LDLSQRLDQNREMMRQFGPAAARQQQQVPRRFVRAYDSRLRTAIPVDERVPDKFDAELRRARGIPGRFEWQNAKQQIVILGHLVGPALPRSPDLRGDILNQLWVPIVEPVAPETGIAPDGMCEAAVEP